jgi:protein-disulfide isomerase
MPNPCSQRPGGRRAAFALIGLATAALLPGCEGREGPEPVALDASGPSGARVVARVDGEAITAEELDAQLQLALHDLARAGYELRAKRLRELIATRLGGSGDADDSDRVEILLAPPEPPRLAVEPVEIVEFLDFESPHCRRMQPVLRRILADYGDEVRLAVRDLPLPFHRNARAAALAAACAGAQGAYWGYHDALLQDRGWLSRDVLERHARRLDLDLERFAACLDAAERVEDVAADARAAQRLGVSSVPTFFVNGLYLKGPQTYAQLARAIDGELGREHRVIEPPPVRLSPEEARRLVPPDFEGQPPPVPVEVLPAPDAILSLERGAVLRALADREQLERQLALTTRSYDGRRMLEVAEVRPGDLFDRLGLRAGDMLVLVDGEWATDLHNPLWAAFAERPEVTLAIMRDARRRIFRYAIE